MKKVYLIGALSGLLLASCANDDLVVKPDAPAAGGNAPIAFNMKVKNQSRATENLENVMDNFGVWAFKADAAAADLKGLWNVTDFSQSAMTVIPNYRVNYLTKTAYGSNWNYVSADWDSNPKSLTQYLKYWDGSVAKTYFFGYGPHWSTRGDAADVTLTFDETDVKATMGFPALQTTYNPNYNYIYSNVTIADNEEHVTPATAGTTLDPTKVSLTFHRIPSQVRIAIWEDIAGYDVEMKTLNLAKGAGSSDEEKAGTYGVAAIPANYSPDKTWARGSYLCEGTPSVVFTTTTNPYDTPALSFSEGKMGKANLDFALPTGNVGTTYAARSFSETTYNVMPTDATTQPTYITSMATGHTWAPNSGLQFVMNYQLKSVDTKETIDVKGARCFVTPEYTAWAPNTIYTYVFKITKNSSGTTLGTDPENNPEHPEDALYPIIFQGVLIESADTNETEWLVNGVEFSAASIIVAPNSTNGKFGYTFDGTDLAWTVNPSTALTVATALTPMTVDPITYPGTATITAGANPGRATIKATNVNGAFATIDVVITNGVDILTTGPVDMTVGDDDVELDFVSDGTAITWSNGGADAVATVTDGKIHAVGAGTATITATLTADPSKTASITVNVTAAP